MKKSLFILILSLAFVLFPKSVFAFELPTPDRVCRNILGGGTECTNNVITSTWWNAPYYEGQYYYLGSFGSTDNIYESLNFQWDNKQFCQGKNILIKGSIGGLFDFFTDYTVWNIRAYNNSSEMSCNIVVEDGSRASFTCAGQGGGSMIFTVNQNAFPSGKTYSIGISKNVEITCDETISNIIVNNQQNTQNIINNQNSNTQSIINNQNTNSQNIINNQNANANQAHQDSQAINNTLNDDSIPTDNSSTASQWASNNASDSVVSDMVLMPITLLNAFSSGFNGTCQPYNLGSLYGTNLTLPCINIQNYLGSTLWTIIDVLMSGFLIYGIGKKFVKVFNDFTNLKDSQVDELYGGGSE